MNYPSHEVVVGKDKCLVYDIPKDKLQEALDKANPLKGHVFFPVGGRKRIPLSNSDKPVSYSNAIIIYYKRYNYIVSPTFFQDGTTSWGWGKRIRVKTKAIHP